MNELAHALNVLGNLPKNVLCKNPAGSWSFVGSVDYRLKFYDRATGGPIALDVLAQIRAHGSGLFSKTVGVCTWPTQDAAIAAAEALGLTVKL